MLLLSLATHRTFAPAALMTAFALVGCGPEEKKGPPPPPLVLVTPARTADVPIVKEWVSTADGFNNAVIRGKVSGYIISQDYQDGSMVKTGQRLFKLDPRPYEADLAQAQANLAKSKAQQLQAESDFQRAIKLLPSSAISQQDYDAKDQANQAAIAEVAAQAAEVQQAQLNLTYTDVTSPIDGFAGIAPVSEGDLVGGSSATTLTTVSTLDPIKITFLISEKEYLEASAEIEAIAALPQEKRPAKMTMTLSDGSEYPEKGQFYAIDRQVNLLTGAIEIEAIFPNPKGIMRPGQYAKTQLQTGLLKNAILVPQRAVIDTQGQYSVMVVADKKAQVRVVKVGPTLGQEWVITSGLNDGESVIVDGTQKARNGAEVNAQPYVPGAKKPAAGEEQPKEATPAPAAKPDATPTPASSPSA